MFTVTHKLTRDELNNKLHYLGDQILKLRMQQAILVDMRDALEDDLYDAMFEEV